MKYYYLNKFAMAVLVALLLFFGTRTLIDILHHQPEPEKPGYDVVATGDDGEGKGEEKVDEGAAFIAALNKADPAKGEQDIAACKGCHSFEKGGPNGLGPNLYGIVGKKIASVEGASYSTALKDHGGDWTFENMDAWLKSPQAFAAGTIMAYPGMPDLQKRANVVAYLNQNSDDPLPLPEPKPEPAAEEPAEEPAADEAPGQPEVIALLETADAAKGEQEIGLCKVCHSFEKGGPAGIGPNLYGIVGQKIAAAEGVNYSPALKDHGGDWTFENLDAWLKNPQEFAAGTSMAYPGMPDAKKRADLIAYLNENSDDPVPLPEAKPEPAAEEPAEEPAAPEDGEATPAEDEAPPAEDEAAPTEEDTAPGDDAAAPSEEPAAETPPAAVEGDESDETIVNPPAVSEDAPSEPHQGEAPSPNQPQPVYPEEEEPAAEAPAAATEDDGAGETVVSPPTVSEDAPSEPHQGEAPSPNQPQPVYPDGDSAADAPAAAMDDGSAEDSEDAPSGAHKGEAPSPNQPQPVYPDGKPDGI